MMVTLTKGDRYVQTCEIFNTFNQQTFPGLNTRTKAEADVINDFSVSGLHNLGGYAVTCEEKGQ